MRTCCPSCGCVLEARVELNEVQEPVAAQPVTDRLEADVAGIVRGMRGFFVLEQVLVRLRDKGYDEDTQNHAARVHRALSFCAHPVRYANGRKVAPTFSGERYEAYAREPLKLKRDESAAYVRKEIGANGMEWLHG